MNKNIIPVKITSEKYNLIYDYLDSGNLIEADKLVLSAYKRGIKKEKSAELLVSIAIEAGSLDLAKARVTLLDEFTTSSYRLFLKARVSFMEKDYWQALTLLEEASADAYMVAANDQVQEKVYNLLGQCYKFYGFPDKAAICYYKAYECVKDINLKRLEYSNYLFNLHYLDIPKEDYYIAHKDYNNLFKSIKKYTHKKKTRKKDKIRIGYLSPDFRNHVVLRFSLALLISYNKEKFEVYCYSTSSEDEYSDFIKNKINKWNNVRGKSYNIVAKQIYEDNIDILVDLCGHCSGSNLPILSYRPAPIQICGIGYFATTGLDVVDYFITDTNLEADNELFVEKLLVLPNSHFCYTPIYQAPELRDAPCLRNNYITFGSFNNLTKVNDNVLNVWNKILNSIPNSRLLLKGSLFDNSEGKELFIQRLENLRFDISRVELRGISKDYLKEYFDMDIALDTYPYPGGGTTCDALYMGVPVITLQDGSHGGNFGGSILRNIGLEFACAVNEDEYVEKAVAFANDKELLNVLHHGLRNMMINSPLMDASAYMRAYESKLIELV